MLQKVSAQVLGLEEFDEEVFLDQIEKIVVNGKDELIFHFYDGQIVPQKWKSLPGRIAGHLKPEQQNPLTAKRTLAVQEPLPAFPAKSAAVNAVRIYAGTPALV